ncbi:MAG: hypothetical protein M3Q98_14865 [Actinomycetota bacterium]|nr:hypothetical protein [Actinomycetota bacterium]
MNKFTNSFLTAQAMVSAVVFGGLQKLEARRDERGVVSIEYIVLGAAIIVLIGVLGSNADVQKALQDAFKNLFNKAGQ